MVATRNPAATTANPRQDLFARLVVGGKTQVQAYRVAYAKTATSAKTAKEGACRIAAHPAVVARIAALRAKSEAPALLSLNARLHKLAAAAEFKPKTAADRNALARVIEVYNKTAGDHAPERQEVTVKGDASNPVAVTSVPMSKAAKIAALAAQRKPRTP